VQKPDASHTLCRIPSKFVKILWVRSGSFIVARFDGEDLEDDDANKDKITGEMTRALYDIQQKEMRKNGRWPELFNEVSSSGGGEDVSGLGGDGEKDDDENSEGGDYSTDSDLPPIEVIKNRTRRPRDDTESDESDEDEDAWRTVL